MSIQVRVLRWNITDTCGIYLFLLLLTVCQHSSALTVTVKMIANEPLFTLKIKKKKIIKRFSAFLCFSLLYRTISRTKVHTKLWILCTVTPLVFIAGKVFEFWDVSNFQIRQLSEQDTWQLAVSWVALGKRLHRIRQWNLLWISRPSVMSCDHYT